MIRKLLSLSVLLLLCSCGYQFSGEGHRLPGDVGTIRVALFDNRTAEAFLDTLVTEHVTRRFMRLHHVHLVEDRALAEAELGGTVTGYSLRAIAYDGNDNIKAYRLTIQINAALTRRHDGKVLWSSDLVRYRDFGVSSVDIGGQEALEAAAQVAVAERLAEDISTQMVSGFGAE